MLWLFVSSKSLRVSNFLNLISTSPSAGRCHLLFPRWPAENSVFELRSWKTFMHASGLQCLQPRTEYNLLLLTLWSRSHNTVILSTCPACVPRSWHLALMWTYHFRLSYITAGFSFIPISYPLLGSKRAKPIMGSVQIEEVDVLLVGAGFGSFTVLNK